MVKGVFFDLYDTLMLTGETTSSVWLESLYSCLKRYGLSISLERFTDKCAGFFSKQEPRLGGEQLTVYEKRIGALCADLGVKIDINGLHHTADRTVEITNRNCCLDKDCHTVLKYLQSRYILALISNFDHPPYIKTMLKYMDIQKYFSAVIISGEAGVKKPDPAIFRLALQKTGLKPREVVHVGDSLQDDIAGAISAGIKPALIHRKSIPDKLSPAFRDDYLHPQGSPGIADITTIGSLPELLEIIEAL